MFIVILVTHPKYYLYRDDGSPWFWRKTVSGGEDGCYHKKFRNFVAWAEPDKKTAFFSFYGTFRLSCAQPTGNSFTPKTMVPMESRDSEGVPFASLESLWPGIWQMHLWRVLKSGHVTIMKIENLHINICRKVYWFQKCYSFRSMMKSNEVYRGKKPFQNSGVTRRLWRFQHAAVLERSTEVRFSPILSIEKKTAKIPPITLVNAWPSWLDARRQYILLVIIYFWIYL